MYDFAYLQPATLDEALEALGVEDAQPLAGGQTLLPTLKARLGQPSRLVDLTGVEGLAAIAVADGAVTIGAAATHAAVAAHPGVRRAIPALADLAGHIGDPQVRNRGTLGGSVANNDPAACYPAAIAALGATVLTSAGEIHADDWFQGMFSTALEPGALVTGARFPVPLSAAYAKFVQPASRFALTGVFVARFADGARVGVTGAAEGGAFRWHEAEAALSADFSAAALEGLSIAPDGMIGDIHGTPEYRAHLVRVMTRRAVEAAARTTGT